MAHSAEFDERLKGTGTNNSVIDQLYVFVEGLIEYTEQRLAGSPPTAVMIISLNIPFGTGTIY